MYTPEPEELVDIHKRPDLLRGFHNWHADPNFAHIFSDLEKIDIRNRPLTLPVLYKYVGSSVHPVRHLHLPNEDAPTYIYVFDSSQEGTKYARDVGLIHSVPYGPVDQMATHGKCSIHHTLDYTYDCVQVYFGFSQAVGLWHAIYGVKEMPRTMLHRHWFPIRRNDNW